MYATRLAFGALCVLVAWTQSAVGGPEQVPAIDMDDCTRASCHDSRKQYEVLHSPVEDDECDSCHVVADAQVHKFELAAQGKELCEECHDDVTEDHTYAHGPAAGGGCIVCHNPHGSAQKKLLVCAKPELCTRCHSRFSQRFSSSDHKHSPAEEDCGDCHGPHGADDRMLLVRSRPGLCLDCHDDLSGLTEESTVKHGAVACNRSCTYCHDPHAAELAHNLRDTPSALCLSCHDKELDSKHGKVPNIAGLLEVNKYRHGPIKENKCAPCHSHVHGGSTFRLLARDYPPEFYSKFAQSEYALCFGCHDSKSMQDERTKTLTEFRNGDVNLHYLHVNRGNKGRSCRACHNSHASDNPKHLTKSVSFGRMHWELPVNCRLNETGGTCSPGCHRTFSYDRKMPVLNIPQKADSAEKTEGQEKQGT